MPGAPSGALPRALSRISRFSTPVTGGWDWNTCSRSSWKKGSLEKGSFREGLFSREVFEVERFASMRAWENADFGPPARNRKKIAEKIDFGLSRKIGKKAPKNRKNGYFLAIFSLFSGRGQNRFFGDFFPDFGPPARNRHSPRHAYPQREIQKNPKNLSRFSKPQ